MARQADRAGLAMSVCELLATLASIQEIVYQGSVEEARHEVGRILAKLGQRDRVQAVVLV
jgi:hypothetical protein